MERKFIDYLRCPYCNSKFKCKFTNKNWGMATCSCDEYPIIEGVFYFIKDDLRSNRVAVTKIKSKKYLAAIRTCLSSSPRNYKIVTLLAYILQRTGLHVSLNSWLKVLKTIGPSKSWIEYILNRERADDMKLALKLVTSFAKRNGAFLDIGYGFGTIQNLLKKINFFDSNASYIGLDKSFCTLFLSSLNESNDNKLLICCDAQNGLPFESNLFSDVAMVDTFCSTFRKKYLLSESARVLQKGRFLYLVNIYETNKKSYFWGYGIGHNDLKNILNKDFKKTNFIENCLTKKGMIKKFSKSSSLNFGYSCYAIK